MLYSLASLCYLQPCYRQVLYAKIVLHEGTEKHPERSTYYLELWYDATRCTL